MIARRKSNLHLPPRMYVYKGKRKTTYYTITPGNERINLGHDFAEAKRKLIEIDSGCRGFESHQPPQIFKHLKKWLIAKTTILLQIVRWLFNRQSINLHFAQI